MEEADQTSTVTPIKRQRRLSTDPRAARAEREALAKKLDAGFRRAQREDQYGSFLGVVSLFYNFSISNIVLIWAQHPNATQVASYRAWLALGRQVRWGEKGIRIMAPTHRRLPPARGSTDGDGEERDISRLRFRIVSVFDVSQTDASDETSPPSPTVRHRENPIEAPDAAKLYEVAIDSTAHIECSRERKTVAESLVCVVLGHFGSPQPAYGFDYLTSWSDPPTFRARLLDIQAITIRLIDDAVEMGAEDVD